MEMGKLYSIPIEKLKLFTIIWNQISVVRGTHLFFPFAISPADKLNPHFHEVRPNHWQRLVQMSKPQGCFKLIVHPNKNLRNLHGLTSMLDE